MAGQGAAEAGSRSEDSGSSSDKAKLAAMQQMMSQMAQQQNQQASQASKQKEPDESSPLQQQPQNNQQASTPGGGLPQSDPQQGIDQKVMSQLAAAGAKKSSSSSSGDGTSGSASDDPFSGAKDLTAQISAGAANELVSVGQLQQAARPVASITTGSGSGAAGSATASAAGADSEHGVGGMSGNSVGSQIASLSGGSATTGFGGGSSLGGAFSRNLGLVSGANGAPAGGLSSLGQFPELDDIDQAYAEDPEGRPHRKTRGGDRSNVGGLTSRLRPRAAAIAPPALQRELANIQPRILGSTPESPQRASGD